MIDFKQPTNQPTNHWQEQKSAVILGIGNPLLDISAEVSQELKSHFFLKLIFVYIYIHIGYRVILCIYVRVESIVYNIYIYIDKLTKPCHNSTLSLISAPESNF